jgi:hypothetical protein
MKKLRFFSIGLLVLAASSAMSQIVRYNFDEKADFSKFKTYKWVPIKGATPAQGLTDQQIRDAFDTKLAAKGLTRVDSETADLFIGYQFGVGKTQKFSSYNSDWGYGAGWETDARHGGSITPEQTSTIYQGELALDMYETAKHTLAWRGVASKAINPKAQPNERQKHLEKAVKKLMEYYPPVAVIGY